MIVRIVKMTFKPEELSTFTQLFDNYKVYIRASEGCTHLDLLQDISVPNVFFTYSHWQTEENLNNYRNSELFEEVWSKTKILFETKAEAWSFKKQL